MTNPVKDILVQVMTIDRDLKYSESIKSELIQFANALEGSASCNAVIVSELNSKNILSESEKRDLLYSYIVAREHGEIAKKIKQIIG